MLKGGIIRLLENKNILEIVLLAVVFATLLYEGSGFIGREISHSYPYGYLASDAFWHENVANYIKKEGSYKYHPPYMSAGYKDVVGFNPPLLYQLVASFSILTGLEAYDAFYILIILLICFSAMAVYFIIKQFNSHVAMLSLPLFVFLFTKRFVIDVTWGQWIFISGGFFIIVFFWGMTKLELRHSYALLVIFIAALASAHQSEMVFAIGFIIIFIAIKSLSKKFDMSEIAPSHDPSFSSEKEGRFLSMLKNTLRPLGRGVFDIKQSKGIALAVIIALVLSSYPLLIFSAGWGKFSGIRPFSVELPSEWNSGRSVVPLTDFSKIVLIVIVIGMVFALLIKERVNVAVPAGFYMLLIGYGNYFGLSNRAFQTRFFWPVYLAVFFGLALYQLVKFVPKGYRQLSSLAITLILLFAFLNLFYEKQASPGLMDPYHWESLSWVRENTDKNAKVFYFYYDNYYQSALLWTSERLAFLIDRNDYIDGLQKGIIKRDYISTLTSSSDTRFIYKKGLFSFGYHQDEDKLETRKQRDICSFDYYIFDMLPQFSSIPELTKYNALIRDKFIEKDMEELFNNQVVSILKNNNPGADCIGG